jgi:hypothetical protein
MRPALRYAGASALIAVILGTEIGFFIGWPFELPDDLRAPFAFWLAVASLLLGGYEILLRRSRSPASLGATLFAILAAAAVGPEGAPGGTGGEIVSLALVGLLLLALLPMTLRLGFRSMPSTRPVPPVVDDAGDNQGQHRRDKETPEQDLGHHPNGP